MSWYSFLKYTIVRPFVKVAYHARVEGEENIPTTGGVILACNHTSATETYLLPALIARQVTYPAKAELFRKGRGVKGIPQNVIAWALKAVGQVPLDRSGGRASADGLGPIMEVLENGGVVGIFPEGTRSPDGRLYKGKTGVARLALATGAPVVPCGSVNAQVTGTFLGIPMSDHPVVKFGKPLDFSVYQGCEDDRRIARWVTDEVMAGIQALSGQTYVEGYGTSVKSGALTAAEADARVRPRPGGGEAPQPCAPPSPVA